MAHLAFLYVAQAPKDWEPCEPIPDRIIIGPARPIAELKIADARLGSEWAEITERSRRGDTAHEYVGEFYGGYIVLRRGCVVGQVMTWIS